jgi:hypothetical protein
MPLLRKITKPKWFDTPWLPPGEVPADALVDLRSQHNVLSVWRVEPDEANLHVVIAAMASDKTERLANFDYVLLDEDVLARLNIQLIQTEGETPHLHANLQWHCDLSELTAMKVVQLAHEVKRKEAEHRRVQHTVVRDILKTALETGELQRTAVTAKLLAELEA